MLIIKLWNVKAIQITTDTLGTIPKGLINGLEELEIGKTSRKHLSYSLIEIGQNTEKSTTDLKILAVTQTPAKDHQLKLVSKFC